MVPETFLKLGYSFLMVMMGNALCICLYRSLTRAHSKQIGSYLSAIIRNQPSRLLNPLGES